MKDRCVVREEGEFWALRSSVVFLAVYNNGISHMYTVYIWRLVCNVRVCVCVCVCVCVGSG